MSRVPDLVRRNNAIEKTKARFSHRPFEWGQFDCVAMARAHLAEMGHRGLPDLPRYHDVRGALHALKEMGHKSLPGLLDSLLPRIAPAMMLPGDIAVLPNPDSPLDAVTLSLGHKLWGWHEGNDLAEPVVIDVGAYEFIGAWRA